MRRFYIEQQITDNHIELNGVEHNHLKNVLRLKENEKIIVVCADGYDYICDIEKINKDNTQLVVVEKVKNEYDSNLDVSVFQAFIKSDNMNLVVQKLTELGIKEFTPFESQYITSKDKFGKIEKLQNISNQSIKQCKRSCPMIVNQSIKFNQLITTLQNYDIVIFANECETKYKLENLSTHQSSKIAIIIGSEGGFSTSEIEQLTALNNVKSVSLGKRILRAETAVIALSAVVMNMLGEF